VVLIRRETWEEETLRNSGSQPKVLPRDFPSSLNVLSHTELLQRGFEMFFDCQYF
jgi:hypothetical protein